MSLSFKEKNQIRKQIGQQMTRLDGAEGLTFKEKNRVRKEIGQLLAKLEAKLGKAEIKNKKLQDLIDGKYMSVDPERFLVILKEIVDEIGDIGPVKGPVNEYLKKNTPVKKQEGINA
jgi:hypothetical protein